MPYNAVAKGVARQHYENTPIQIHWKFYNQKWEKFQVKKFRHFSYSCSKHRFVDSLEPPRRGGSNEYPRSMFFSKIKKIVFASVKPIFIM